MLEIFCLKLCGLRQAFGIVCVSSWGQTSLAGVSYSSILRPSRKHSISTRSISCEDVNFCVSASATLQASLRVLLPILPDHFSPSPILITFDAFCYTTHRRVPSCMPHFFGTSNSSSKIYRPRSWSYGPVNHFFETCACCCLPLRPHLRRVLQSNWFFMSFPQSDSRARI